MTVTTRQTLADVWHKRALVPRLKIFADEDEGLRPILPQSHADVSVPGMVGPHFEAGGLAVVSINPAGGTDTFKPTKGDGALYAAAKATNHTNDLAAFEVMNEAYIAGMPSWGAQWWHIRAILEASGSALSRLAYPYLVPFRTRGDNGSRLKPEVVSRAYDLGFVDVFAALQPSLVVTVDRLSEAAVAKYQAEQGTSFLSIYYTRQRSAHKKREETLQKIRELAKSVYL